MEQKPTPDLLAAARKPDFARNELIPPSDRFNALLTIHGLSDDATAAMLMVSRPVVARLRLGSRPPSFDLAARVEVLLGIPCAHWRTVPDSVVRSRAVLKANLRQRLKDEARAQAKAA
jgi:transcriptional regulator with XRE-family HTH domain